MEKRPDTLQSFHAFVGIEEVVPSAALELQNVPRLICVDSVGSVGRNVTFAEREKLQVPFVDPEMQDGDVVVH